MSELRGGGQRPSDRKIAQFLTAHRSQGYSVGELAKATAYSRPAVIQSTKRLLKAGVIDRARHGRQYYYFARAKGRGRART